MAAVLQIRHSNTSRHTHITYIFSTTACKFFSDWVSYAGGAVLCLHQWALSAGLIDIVHADERGPQLWHLNKEGLLSVPGYWALALLSKGLSSYLHPELQASGTKSKIKFSSRQAYLGSNRSAAAYCPLQKQSQRPNCLGGKHIFILGTLAAACCPSVMSQSWLSSQKAAMSMLLHLLFGSGNQGSIMTHDFSH